MPVQRPGGSAILPGSRRLLRRLRTVMAGDEPAQAKLDTITEVIAGEMVAEVCSIYLRRAGDILELFASQGLRQEAVHHTRLYIGEGLVGDIAAHARPLALAEAQRHPQFAYRPETGEEIFHSLLGVPILKDARVLGVLVVQNRKPRQYFEEEIETLETVAMVLAEMVVGAQLVGITDRADTAGNALTPTRLIGLKMNTGVGIGKAVIHTRQVALANMVADNVIEELQRLETALAAMQAALDQLLQHQGVSHGEQHDILAAYRMFAEDAGWISRIREAINTGLTAEAAVARVQSETRVRLAQVADPYLRERLHDLEDLANRLQQHLAGRALMTFTEDFVVFGRAMGPVELLDYQSPHLRGLVLEEGSPTAHVAVIARALGVPVVGRASGALRHAEQGDFVILDGDRGHVYIRPNDDVLGRFYQALKREAEKQAVYLSERALPATTTDHFTVSLLINAGFSSDVTQAHDIGAAGVGLFRTEIPFMLRNRYPDVVEQQQIYSDVLKAAQGKPVVFRTLDIGGDKTLAYLPGITKDENPAMGWRALRLSLDRPAMLKGQLQALLRAAAGMPLHVMFPMITDVAEFCSAKAIFVREQEKIQAEGGELPSEIYTGAMLEVPALLWQLPALLAEVDFVSVGSNDLMQFLFACDRGSAKVGNRYDVLAPAMLAMLRQLVIACDAANIPLTLCGEMAASPLEAMALVGLGFRRLSMAPRGVGAVRSVIRTMARDDLANYLDSMQNRNLHSLRGQLKAYALDHGIPL